MTQQATVQSHTTPTPMRDQLFYWLEQAGMLLVLLLLVIFCSLTVPGFFGLRNLDSLLLAVSTVGMISCTMLFCLASGNFDLSVGTLVPCAGVVTAVVINKFAFYGSAGAGGAGTWGCVPVGNAAPLGPGGVAGVVDGLVVAQGQDNPLITTPGT